MTDQIAIRPAKPADLTDINAICNCYVTPSTCVWTAQPCAGAKSGSSILGGMQAIMLTACLLLLMGNSVFGAPQAGPREQPPSSPLLRLAILSETPSTDEAAAVLTAEWSHQPGFSLVERAEIARVFRELALSASQKDYLRAGQLLSADGLILLGSLKRATNVFVQARLVAAREGVILGAMLAPWPVPDTGQWSERVWGHFEALLPKLAVPTRDAVPLSVLNLKSTLRTPQAQASDKELTLLLIHRLSRERELFVLERQHMREVLFEQELRPEEESAFWTGRYLLDGILDKDGFDPARVTIAARLAPPRGGQVVSLQVAGPRSDPAAVVEALAAQVLAALQRPSAAAPWQPRAEAGEFLQEARWARRWGLLAEAQAAIESAWALGDRSRDTALFRIRVYSDDIDPNPQAQRFAPAERALELLSAAPWLRSTTAAEVDESWYDLGLRTLARSSALLDGFYSQAELRPGNEEALGRLRAAIREAASLLDTNRTVNPLLNQQFELSALEWGQGGMWQERPEDALPLFHKVLARGYGPSSLPRFAAWSWNERKRLPSLTKQFVEQCRATTNPGVRLEALYLTLLWTPVDHEGRFQAVERDLLRAISEQAQALWTDPAQASLLGRTEAALSKKHGYIFTNTLKDEAFRALKQEVRLSYLGYLQSALLNSYVLDALFPHDARAYSPSEAAMLLPPLRSLQQRVALQGSDARSSAETLGRLATFLARSYPVAGKSTAPVGSPPASHPRKREPAVAAEFRPWALDLSGVDPEWRLLTTTALARAGQVWFQVGYGPPGAYQSRFWYVRVDPRTGESRRIVFPPKLGKPDLLWFEVTDDSLFVSVWNHLARYRFAAEQWEMIPVPIEQGSQVVALGSRVYLAGADNLLELALETGQVSVVASSRRQPRQTALDSAWMGPRGVGCIFARQSGDLGVVGGDDLFVLKPGERAPKVWASLAALTSSREYLPACANQGIDRLIFKGRNGNESYLATVRQEASDAECLLRQTAPEAIMHGQKSPSRLGAPRWNWPAQFRLDDTRFAVEGDVLWGIVPPATGRWGGAANPESLDPRDGPSARVLKFEPSSPRPLASAVRFEREGRAIDPFDLEWQSAALRAQLMWAGPLQRIYWLSTPDGLVLACPMITGHWFLAKASLAASLRPLQDAPLPATALRPAGTNRSPVATP